MESKDTDKTVTFIINNKDNKEYVFKMNEKILDVRNKLCEEFNMKNKFCSIECILEFPIRKFGILTLNPGELGDIYDNERLDRFNIEEEKINIKINFENKKSDKIDLTKIKKFRKKQKKSNTFVYNESDFPPLG